MSVNGVARQLRLQAFFKPRRPTILPIVALILVADLDYKQNGSHSLIFFRKKVAVMDIRCGAHFALARVPRLYESCRG